MARLSLKQVAYNTIRDNLLNCTYEPGQFLNEDILCEELNMSRTPIRDALGRLEQEHLITIYPKKGIYVSQLSLNEINDVFEGRFLLEPYIIRTYCQHLRKDILDELRQLLKEEIQYIDADTSDTFRIDDQFHSILTNQCTNDYLLQLDQNLNSQNSRMRCLSGRYSSNRLQHTVDEHTKILYELSMNHIEAAAKAMEEHLLASKESALEVFMKTHPIL